MKMPFKKAIYRDVFERTRGLRIGFFLFSAVLTVIAYNTAGSHIYPPNHARLSVWPMVLLAVSFAVFQEIRIHAYHRKKKWEWFYTIPFDKGEWYWTSRAAEVTNLAILVIVMSIEEYIACVIMVKTRGLSQIGMPFVRQAFYAFAAGVLFMAFLSVMRELTHTTAAFFGLLIMTLAAVYLSLEMIEEVTAFFTKGFGDFPIYWPTRFCLTERTFMRLDIEDLDDIAIVYDTLAIIVAIPVAWGLMLLGRKLAASSRAEYVGADDRNKKLFVTFVSISLILAFQVFALVVGEIGFSAYCLLFLLLFVLIIVLFCRLLRERSMRKVGMSFLIAAAAVVLLTGVSGLASLIGRQVPKEDRIVGVEQDGYIFTDRDAVSKAYKEIMAEKNRRADGGKSEGKYITYTVYTKFGRRSFEIPDTTENGLIIITVLGEGYNYRDVDMEFRFDPSKAVLRYGNKPVVLGNLESGEYEKLIKQIPEAYKKELPVYRTNLFGGLSLSKETVVTVPDSIPEGSGYLVTTYLENQLLNNSSSVNFLFPAEPEVMRYYLEEIQAPKWKEIRNLIRESARYDIQLTFPPKEEDNADPFVRFFGTRCLKYTAVQGKGGVCYGYIYDVLSYETKRAGKTAEEVETLLGLSGEVSYEGGEYVLAMCFVSCFSERMNDPIYEQNDANVLLVLPKDRVERIFSQLMEAIPEETE